MVASRPSDTGRRCSCPQKKTAGNDRVQRLRELRSDQESSWPGFLDTAYDPLRVGHGQIVVDEPDALAQFFREERSPRPVVLIEPILDVDDGKQDGPPKAKPIDDEHGTTSITSDARRAASLSPRVTWLAYLCTSNALAATPAASLLGRVPIAALMSSSPSTHKRSTRSAKSRRSEFLGWVSEGFAV